MKPWALTVTRTPSEPREMPDTERASRECRSEPAEPVRVPDMQERADEPESTDLQERP